MLKDTEGEASKKVAAVAGLEEIASEKGGLLSEPERTQLKKMQVLKGAEGASLRTRSTAGDGVKKGTIEKKLEDDDVYNMDTCILAPPNATPADKSGGTEKTPTKDNIVGSPKKNKKTTGKVNAVGKEHEASAHVRCEESNDILGSPIIAGSFKLLVFNVHGTLLDCSLLEERNPNNEIRPSMKATSRRVICRP
jgi:hypothetical protein